MGAISPASMASSSCGDRPPCSGVISGWITPIVPSTARASARPRNTPSCLSAPERWQPRAPHGAPCREARCQDDACLVVPRLLVRCAR